jgi:hypothetical protein
MRKVPVAPTSAFSLPSLNSAPIESLNTSFPTIAKSAFAGSMQFSRSFSTVSEPRTAENPFIPLQQLDPHSYPLGDAQFVEFENLVDLQSRGAKMFAHKPLFGVYRKDGNRFDYITYQDFNVLVDYTRGVLDLLGVKKDEKVALICNNRVEWAASLYATVGRGGQLVPM